MRNLILCTAALAAIAACGPSNKDVALAKTARYTGDKVALFRAAKAATEAKYTLAESDETTLGMKTIGRWYTPEGLAASERNGDMRDVPDRSINIALVVRLLPDGDSWVVSVEPKMVRYFAGRPNPDVLTPDDPSVPGWATGKVDQLQFAIHEALKGYEVKEPGGVVPAPTPAPTPTPAAAPAPEPAAGSATPPPATP